MPSRKEIANKPSSKKIDGRYFVEPDGYIVTPHRTMYTTNVKGVVISKVLIFSAVLITARAIDADDGTEDVEITFRLRGSWRSLWTARRNISDARKIIDFSDYGLAVNSGNATKLVQYLSAYEAFNDDTIPNTLIARCTGWKAVQGHDIFVMNRPTRDKDRDVTMTIQFKPDFALEKFLTAMKPRGTYLKWKEAITSAIAFPRACFAFFASFAAPLLRILNAPSFILHFWGDTSSGKTTVMELAASIWGNPHKENGGLLYGWDSTRVFHERMATFFSDLPIYPDDSQGVDDKTLQAVLYQLANGTGKGRGSLFSVQQLRTWRTVVFSSGENKITECTSFGGARARTIEVYGSPFENSNGKFVNRFKHSIRENYGHAGPVYIDGLLGVIKDPNRLARIKAEFNRYQQDLSTRSGSEVGDRLSQYFAVVLIAAQIVNRVLNIGNPEKNEKVIYEIFDEVQRDNRRGDLQTRAMDDVISWISSNEIYFRKTERQQYGVIRDGDWIGIYKHKLSEFFRRDNYAEFAVLKGWAKRGWIKIEDSGHYTCPRRIKLDNGDWQCRRLVIIPWRVFLRFTGAE